MPIYEYLCKACHHRFEHLVLRSSATVSCPVCQSQDLEQLISTCAVHSEGASQANLSAAHRKAAAARGARHHDEHRNLHEHFDDRPTPAGQPQTDQSAKKNEE